MVFVIAVGAAAARSFLERSTLLFHSACFVNQLPGQLLASKVFLEGEVQELTLAVAALDPMRAGTDKAALTKELVELFSFSSIITIKLFADYFYLPLDQLIIDEYLPRGLLKRRQCYPAQ